MRVSTNFILQEFVDKDTFQKYGNKSIWFIDDRLFKIAQELRNRFGSATINNWNSGGSRNWSGLRTSKSSYYSSYSQHSFGRAIDMVFSGITAEEIRDAIREDEQFWFNLGVRAIENDVSWLHIDIRSTKAESIKWFNV